MRKWLIRDIYSSRRHVAMRFHQRGFISGLSFSLLLLGCSQSGPERAEVSGTVFLNGQPLESGAIQLIPVEGTRGPSAGAAVINGKYHIPIRQGATVGKNRVELHGSRRTDRKMQDPTGKPGVLTDERTEAFPADYNSRSTLVREIKEGANVLDFRVDTNDG